MNPLSFSNRLIPNSGIVISIALIHFAILCWILFSPRQPQAVQITPVQVSIQSEAHLPQPRSAPVKKHLPTPIPPKHTPQKTPEKISKTTEFATVKTAESVPNNALTPHTPAVLTTSQPSANTVSASNTHTSTTTAEVSQAIVSSPKPAEPKPPAPAVQSTAPLAIDISQVSYRIKPEPEYPEISEKFQETGTVYILIEIDTKGRVSKAEITKSSGYRRLDQAALKAMRLAQFNPYIHNGQARPAPATAPIAFN